MTPTDLVLSYGDLIRQSGYKTRVMGELRFLEQGSRLDPFLLAFDRDADRNLTQRPPDIPSRFRTRHAALFYAEVARIARRRALRVIHAHNLYSTALALSARPMWRYKVILDLHGRIPEEYVNLGKGGPWSARALNALERWAVTRSDHVVVVSEKLRDYVVERYGLPPSRVSVIPCCADGAAFRVDTRVRETERKRLNLTGKFVCVHLGTFADWYRPEVILAAFTQIHTRVPEAHLLVVTPDSNAAREYLGPRLPPDRFTVMSLPHDQVPRVLNAADLGFLILPDETNIAVSSPTKFPEYLNCGLPVLISPGVGDFTRCVSDHGVGQVLEGSDRPGPEVSGEFLRAVVSQREEFGRRCVEAGKTLRWEFHRETWSRIIGELTTGRA